MILTTREFQENLARPPHEWQDEDLYIINARTNEVKMIVKVEIPRRMKVRQEVRYAIEL